MNAVVIYDSQYGNTERVAEAIAGALGTAGAARAVRVGEEHPDVPAFGADLLVVGGPTQGWRPTPALRDYVAAIPDTQVRDTAVACFDTRFRKPRWLTGSAATHLARALERRGGMLVSPPESFFVRHSEGPLNDGEIERAVAWAGRLLQRVGAKQPQPLR